MNKQPRHYPHRSMYLQSPRLARYLRYCVIDEVPCHVILRLSWLAFRLFLGIHFQMAGHLVVVDD
jgi:hypothetical protein